MSTIKKLVNIYPSMPITDFNPPIRVATKHVYKTIGDIRTCLMRRAIVDEILSNGSIVRLNLGNYNKVLEPVAEKAPVAAPVVEESVVAPAVETEEAVVEEEVTEPEVDVNKEAWTAAYNEALAGVDLSAMSNKQRKAAKAAARATADEAVAKLAEVVEEAAPEVEETVEAEEVVVTADVEDLSSVIE